MIRAVWFLAKLAALAGAVAWMQRHPGQVALTWGGYVVETSTAVLTLAVAALFITLLFIDRAWRALRGLGAALRARRVAAGHKALTVGFVALAAGDAARADRAARRAQKLLSAAPLPLLLSAQAAQLRGDAAGAKAAFEALARDKDAAFLGVKGLLQDATAKGDSKTALDLARRAEALIPGRPWVARALADLEARNGRWTAAWKALSRARRREGVTREEERSQRQAILLAQAGEKTGWRARRLMRQAFGLDPAFTPAAARLAERLLEEGRRRAALNVLRAAWVAAPHPWLADLWMRAQPSASSNASPYSDGKNARSWARRLADLTPGHVESACFLETLEGRPPRDQAWICASCGESATTWSPLCPACGAFNAQSWSVVEKAESLAAG